MTCWVLHMWQQADQRTISLEPIENYGWAIKDKSLTILWDSEDNITAIRDEYICSLKGVNSRQAVQQIVVAAKEKQ